MDQRLCAQGLFGIENVHLTMAKGLDIIGADVEKILEETMENFEKEAL